MNRPYSILIPHIRLADQIRHKEYVGRHAGLFQDGPGAREIVLIAVVEGDGDGSGRDVLLPAQVGREGLERERDISEALEQFHLRAEIPGRDAERAEFPEFRFRAYPVITKD